MPKRETMLEAGRYRVLVDKEKTRKAYRGLSGAGDEAALFFRHLLPRADKESLSYLRDLGIDPGKITRCRPLSEPDEKGEILYFAAAPFCGRVLSGEEVFPRQSAEVAGLSVIFTEDRSDLRSGFEGNVAELRFVIPLPFDPDFFAK